MKSRVFNPTRFTVLGYSGIACLAVLVGLGGLLPQRTQDVQAQTILQNGVVMAVRFKLQSPWPWSVPSRVVKMEVTINGENVPVAREAYYGLNPLDLNRKAIIAEANGFPEIVAWGAPKSSLSEVRWRFLNYSFSERDMIQNRQRIASYYVEPFPAPQQKLLALSNSLTSRITVPEESVKMIPTKGAR